MDKNNNQINLLLSCYRVLDLTDEKGYLCGKILGDLGAEVTRIEKPGLVRDWWWWAYNANKTIVQLDIEQEQNLVLQLAKEADFVIESYAPGYLERLGLGYSTIKQINPQIIYTSITPYGQSGPYRDYQASDLEIMAMSGTLYGIGDTDRPPVRISFPQAYLITSAEAAVGTLMANYWRRVHEEGQQVDVSAQASVLGVLVGDINHWKYEKNMQKRIGGCHGPMEGIKLGGGVDNYHHPLHQIIWECKDGYVAFLMHGGPRGARNNSILTKYFEQDGDLPEVMKKITWEAYDLGQVSPEALSQVWDTFGRFFKRHTRKEIYQIAVKESLELFPTNTVKEVLDNEQLAARQFWQVREIEGLGKAVKYPGAFARVSIPEVRGEARANQPEEARLQTLPFAGVKVLDFSWVYIGPWLTQWLSVYGAEVVKVESKVHLDTTRRSKSGYSFAAWNSSKKDITINLKHPAGKELIRKLVEWADVVVENFSPGTMQRLGFGYEELRKINPRVVMLSASMFGANGPHAGPRGLGYHLTSLAGFNDLTGWPDRAPVLCGGAYTDIIACRIAGSTLFAALEYQRRTGQGSYIDLSQFEASLHFLTPLILEYQASGKLISRMGNRSLTDAPHGVFLCQGEDRWIALSVSSDKEWQALCKVMGKEEWGKDDRYTTLGKRKEHEEELEKQIGAWTAGLKAEEVMERLQKEGVKAGVVQDQEDLCQDPQLSYRRCFLPVKHSQLGEYVYSGAGFQLEKGELRPEAAPLFGEHTEYVCKQILGLTPEEYQAYLNSGALE